MEYQKAPAVRRFALGPVTDIIAQMFAFLLELWVSLEEHQDALELIMSKYRKQMLQLMVAKKAVDTEPVLKAHQSHSAEIESQIDRICEMGEVMRKAVQVDDNQFCKIQEKLAQLEENEDIRLRNMKTTGQMRYLKKNDKSSRENVPRKRVNWAGRWWRTPLIPALGRQSQADLCEFEASLVSKASSRKGAKLHRETLSRKTKKKKKKKKKKKSKLA
ncbi:suppressor of IKBKE 1 isoform X2 [Peromyscus californicus insignis]|uniref:suppressor of IKBKE 1 isoform X2 n=1 Tax=Peromyscus californicus insignis TaxID=564181 RepID=UPI0022A75A34|nr:suppressor of IKBKE 1 isoform X2 [Peromyscus californicus insignis]XP_052586974.1 suppressor of IKBKE 1 isoform X2 [Peromyscus californicus insignis]